MKKEEAIALKGCRDGVRIIVSRDVGIRDILDSLHNKSREYKSFFKGYCNIIVTGRKFSYADKLRINSVLCTILPDCPVSYEEQAEDIKEEIAEIRTIQDTDIFKEEKKDEPSIQKTILKFFGAKDIELEEEQEEIIEVPDKMVEVRGKLCDNIYIYEGSVKENCRLRAQGDLLITGDTEPGSEVVAVGSIYVFGKVRGRIWAGCNGNDSACIISYDLEPDEMRISDNYLRFPNNGRVNKRPEKAYLLQNTIYIDEYL